MTRRADPTEQRARELALAAGVDPIGQNLVDQRTNRASLHFGRALHAVFNVVVNADAQCVCFHHDATV